MSYAFRYSAKFAESEKTPDAGITSGTPTINLKKHTMFNPIVLDIETIPATSQFIADYIAATIKPPATIKLPASIEKWHKESKQEAIAEAIEKTGLDGAFGQVVCIGYDLHDSGQPEAVYGLDEPDLLTRFNAVLDTIQKNLHNATTVVGHNIGSFDLRFLFQRYVVNGIRPHPIISAAAKAKPWDANVYDTMTQFAGFGNKISLDKLCVALGIPTPKGDMDGSMVGKAVADGRLLDVVEYCKRDIIATRLAYRRMTFVDSPGIKAECFYDELPFKDHKHDTNTTRRRSPLPRLPVPYARAMRSIPGAE